MFPVQSSFVFFRAVRFFFCYMVYLTSLPATFGEVPGISAFCAFLSSCQHSFCCDHICLLLLMQSRFLMVLRSVRFLRIFFSFFPDVEFSFFFSAKTKYSCFASVIASTDISLFYLVVGSYSPVDFHMNERHFEASNSAAVMVSNSHFFSISRFGFQTSASDSPFSLLRLKN